MFYADTVGPKTIYERIPEFRRTLEPRYWTPAPAVPEREAAQNTSA